MQEDFLHYLWQHKKFDVLKLETTSYENIDVISVGQHNVNAGPDFFNAKIRIGDQLWAGNVEIHIKTSDWYAHHHETDKAYDNVILHVVWEHDTDIFRRDNSTLPTLVLKDFVQKATLNNYKKLFQSPQKWINCENDFKMVDDFLIQNWLERLYFERLERKVNEVEEMLETSKHDWEAVLFKMLAKNFGLNMNGDAFLSIANAIDYSIIRKLQSNPMQLEALLFGLANLLDNDIQEAYVINLQKEYQFLKTKFHLTNEGVLPIQFFRLRPTNFPTIRLAQLASLYGSVKSLSSEILAAKSIKEIYDIFNIGVSPFWEQHYTFEKSSKKSNKKLTRAFVNLIIINTVTLFKFSYAKKHGNSVTPEILSLIKSLPSEKNGIVSKFNAMKVVSKSALQSQGVLQLKSEYCEKNKCLQCEIGNVLLNRNM